MIAFAQRAALAAIVVIATACSGPTASSTSRSAAAPTVGPTAAVSGASTPSPGCGKTSARSGTTHDTMTLAGLGRSWDLHVPAAHDGRTPIPLVVQLHGYGGNPSEMAFTGLEALGDEEGFIVATPLGRGSKPHWLFELDKPALDVTLANPDIAFIGALIERLGHNLCLDTSRIFVAGHSNGAWMTSALPCALGDRIAAIAPVSGVLDFGDACRPARPVPVIAFHGSADTVLPIEGGFDPALLEELKLDTSGSFGGDNPIWAVPIRERMAGLATRAGCRSQPVSDSVSADAERLVWACPAGMGMQLVVVDGGGHDWPRSEPGSSNAPAASPRKVDAARVMWDFFKEHRLPAR